MRSRSKVGLYPGNFDPVTYGHIDIIKRALCVFDEVVVAVSRHSTEKSPLFSPDERIALLERAVRGLKGVRVEGFDGLVVDFAKKKGASAMIRGVRMISDFEYEFQMALTNRKLAGVETMFLMPHEAYAYLSSRLIKEVALLRGDIRPFAPDFVVKAVLKKYSKKDF